MDRERDRQKERERESQTERKELRVVLLYFLNHNCFIYFFLNTKITQNLQVILKFCPKEISSILTNYGRDKRYKCTVEHVT